MFIWNNENKGRIIIEIIEKIKKVVGNDFIISVKINVNDGVENCIIENVFLTICKLIGKAEVELIQKKMVIMLNIMLNLNLIFFMKKLKI